MHFAKIETICGRVQLGLGFRLFHNFNYAQGRRLFASGGPTHVAAAGLSSKATPASINVPRPKTGNDQTRSFPAAGPSGTKTKRINNFLVVSSCQMIAWVSPRRQMPRSDEASISN
ncbi:hypothetical protein [Tardiphaga sp.]|uniref:hypothetical protein n=1 Tax=Tardiphaga sp. TaxID=1926292 RepID=UPI002631BC65|nr:hypothetical protein [Tardiphaga sp.]